MSHQFFIWSKKMKTKLTAKNAHFGGLTSSLFEKLEQAGVEMYVGQDVHLDLDGLVKGWLQELLDRAARSNSKTAD